MMTNLESYLRGLKGVTNLLRPYKGKYEAQIGDDGIGMTVTFDGIIWRLFPEKYETEDALHSAMWSHAEYIWEQMQKFKTERVKNV